MQSRRTAKVPAVAAESDETPSVHAPKKLTPMQNLIMTLKVLAGAALLLAAIWGLNAWTSAD